MGYLEYSDRDKEKMKKLSRVHKFFRYQKKPKLQDKWTKGWEVQPNNTENTSNKTVAENFINIEEKWRSVFWSLLEP